MKPILTHSKSNIERTSLNQKKKKEEEKLRWRKPQSESSHSNKAAYTSNHEGA